MNTRFCIIALSSLLILPTATEDALGQDDDQLAKVQHYEGGHVDLSFAATSLALLGPGAGGLQTTVAPIFPGPGRHLHNPALLGMSRRVLLAADIGPRLDLNLASLFDLDAEVAEATDDFLAEQMAEDGTLVSSQADASVSHPGGLGAASLTLPARSAALAFSMDRALDLDLQLLATGIQSWADMEKEVGDRTESVALRADLDLNARLRLKAQRYSAAVGYAPRSNLWAGLGFDWLACLAQVNGLADVEGMMTTAGREFVFGDPEDSWENSLDQSLDGRYEGGAWALRLGGGWRPLPRLALGLSWQYTSSLILAGDADLTLRRLAAYEDGGIDTAELSLSSPTETEIVESPVDETLRVAFPGSVTLGLATFCGPFSVSLDGTLYTGSFRIEYLDAIADLRPRGQIKTGIYTRHLSLSLGLLLAEPFLLIDGESEEPGLLPLPTFTLGGGRRFGDHLRLDALLSAAPLPSLRLSGTLLF